MREVFRSLDNRIVLVCSQESHGFKEGKEPLVLGKEADGSIFSVDLVKEVSYDWRYPQNVIFSGRHSSMFLETAAYTLAKINDPEELQIAYLSVYDGSAESQEKRARLNQIARQFPHVRRDFFAVGEAEECVAKLQNFSEWIKNSDGLSVPTSVFFIDGLDLLVPSECSGIMQQLYTIKKEGQLGEGHKDTEKKVRIIAGLRTPAHKFVNKNTLTTFLFKHFVSSNDDADGRLVTQHVRRKNDDTFTEPTYFEAFAGEFLR